MIFMAAYSQNNFLFTETKMSAGFCWHLSTLQNLFRKRNLQYIPKVTRNSEVTTMFLQLSLLQCRVLGLLHRRRGVRVGPAVFFPKRKKDKTNHPAQPFCRAKFFKRNRIYIFVPGILVNFGLLRETFSCSFLPIEKPAFVQRSGVANS